MTCCQSLVSNRCSLPPFLNDFKISIIEILQNLNISSMSQYRSVLELAILETNLTVFIEQLQES